MKIYCTGTLERHDQAMHSNAAPWNGREMAHIAEWLNDFGRQQDDKGSKKVASILYRLASVAAPKWSVPYYNLGLLTKYQGQWEQSCEFNQRAVELNPQDEAAWWNLGIAATALKDWAEARRAWEGFGIRTPAGHGELQMDLPQACVRLDPPGNGEVVWGKRLDPARIVVLNVPLPESKHRYHDIVLHDGAQNGTRVSNGQEAPVFDELTLWKPSEYSTFEVELTVPDKAAEEGLVDLCHDREIGVEDWSTIRFICAECSRGNLGPHEHKPEQQDSGTCSFGFGAKTQDELLTLLAEWVGQFPDAGYSEPELLLGAGGPAQ
jgi:hypothetical protein